MVISELITYLENEKRKHGDREVVISQRNIGEIKNFYLVSVGGKCKIVEKF